jgi:hypothetical protein
MNTQNKRLLNYLQENDGLTAMGAWAELGIARIAARVFDLRKQGYNITSTRMTVMNRFHEPCEVAWYALSDEDKLTAKAWRDAAESSW